MYNSYSHNNIIHTISYYIPNMYILLYSSKCGYILRFNTPSSEWKSSQFTHTSVIWEKYDISAIKMDF